MNIDDGRVVSNFIAQAVRGESLTVQSPGTQTRSFCYVSDMVDGLMRLMEGNHTGPINIGNPGEFTMLELAETVKELINPDVEIMSVENTPDDPRQRKPDITKANELLGWQPKIKLRDMLEICLQKTKIMFSRSHVESREEERDYSGSVPESMAFFCRTGSDIPIDA